MKQEAYNRAYFREDLNLSQARHMQNVHGNMPKQCPDFKKNYQKEHKMKKTTIATLALCVAMLFSCGKKHEAKTTVKEFISENIAVDDYSIESYAELDSTTYVTPEMVSRMHQEAAKNKAFKTGIKYADYKKKKLLYLPVKMEINKEKAEHTFYLTEDVREIVAFK